MERREEAGKREGKEEERRGEGRGKGRGGEASRYRYRQTSP